MKNISPVTLPPGNYAVVAKGFNAINLNGNLGLGSPIMTGDNGSRAISYTGTGLYGNPTPSPILPIPMQDLPTGIVQEPLISTSAVIAIINHDNRQGY